MKVNTPDGFKKYRFADVAEVDPKTNKVKKYHQVGKKTKKGNPVKRERDAIKDIKKATETDVEFHSYN